MPHCDFRESVYMKSVFWDIIFFCTNCLQLFCSIVLVKMYVYCGMTHTSVLHVRVVASYWVFLTMLLWSIPCLGYSCLAGCVFVISDYPDRMDHSILNTWTEVHLYMYIIMTCHYKKFDHMRMFIVPRFCMISYTPLFIYMELYMYKASFRLRFWFILISFQKLFLGCSLSGLAAYPPVFTVHVRVQWTCHTLNLN